jgi:polysaccharide biosynthesis protein PslH
MRLLWVKTDFLHPTTRGGQIRTLEMLKRLHRRHEVHYVAFHDPSQPEGLARSNEYSSRAYPIEHRAPRKPSLGFAWQLLRGWFSPTPVAMFRWESSAMRDQLADLLRAQRFDAIVCDFIFPGWSLGDALERAVLFEHNVETMIWRRHAEHASDPLRRFYFHLQAQRMFAREQSLCRRARHVVAVSPVDAQMFHDLFGIKNVSTVATGVDLDYFRPAAPVSPQYDIVFVGSMDWMPNQDAVRFFVETILPLVRRALPDCRVGIVGRTPPGDLIELGRRGGRVTFTGTVPDVRPFLWGATMSIVPLRIGGGTRLKIYESMAAGTPVVSTTVGAEGLDVTNGEHLRLADTPESFAAACVDLLENPGERARLSATAQELVAARFSWDAVTKRFEQILIENPAG